MNEQLKSKDYDSAVSTKNVFDIAKSLSDDLRDAIGETRRLARRLSPISLENDGLADALQALADNVNHGGRLKAFVNASERVRLHDSSVANRLGGAEKRRESLSREFGHSLTASSRD